MTFFLGSRQWSVESADCLEWLDGLPNGSGTTGVVARRLGLRFVGCDLNEEYVEMARKRLISDSPMFN